MINEETENARMPKVDQTALHIPPKKSATLKVDVHVQTLKSKVLAIIRLENCLVLGQALAFIICDSVITTQTGISMAMQSQGPYTVSFQEGIQIICTLMPPFWERKEWLIEDTREKHQIKKSGKVWFKKEKNSRWRDGTKPAETTNPLNGSRNLTDSTYMMAE